MQRKLNDHATAISAIACPHLPNILDFFIRFAASVTILKVILLEKRGAWKSAIPHGGKDF
jgi:hypothetical protein